VEGLLKLIKEYKATKNKKAYLLILLEKSRKLQLPTYSLIQLLNSIHNKHHDIISYEGWIEKDVDLQQQRIGLEKEKAELKKAKSEFKKGKNENTYYKGSVLVISIIAVSLFLFFYVIPNYRVNDEEEMWKNALIENTIASYNNFMIQYPKSVYFKKAQEQNRIIKEKLKKPNPLMDSSTISDSKIEKESPSINNSKIKQKEINKETEIKQSEVNYEKALEYYYLAREKVFLKEYNEALFLMDSALSYNNNNQYVRFRSNIEKNLIAQKESDGYNKIDKNIRIEENEETIKETIVKSNQINKTKVIEATKTNNLIKKEVFNENISFTVVEEVPTYPGCKGSNEEKKECIIDEIAKHFNKKFRISTVNKLKLNPGKKRIFVQFKIDKGGNIVSTKAKGPHNNLEIEAIRVAQLLPNMVPGKHKGRTVNVKYTLPITLIVD